MTSASPSAAHKPSSPAPNRVPATHRDVAGRDVLADLADVLAELGLGELDVVLLGLGILLDHDGVEPGGIGAPVKIRTAERSGTSVCMIWPAPTVATTGNTPGSSAPRTA